MQSSWAGLAWAWALALVPLEARDLMTYSAVRG